jgi:predicted amidohydrolase
MRYILIVDVRWYFMRVAAIQMNAILADVFSNMKTAEKLVTEAALAGAELIMLPEFFTSGIAFDDKMLDIVSWDIKTQTDLITLSKKLNVIIGGSYLTFNSEDALNTFQLIFPNGDIFTHSKDIPTQFENCYYTNGDEDNILHTSIGNIGVALCWEMIRYDTIKSLLGKVNFVLAGSCWWDLPDDIPLEHQPLREYNQKLALDTPVTFAKILNVPVIHANHCSQFTSYNFPQADKLQTRQMVGAAQIINANGEIIARRTFDKGEGFVMSDIQTEVCLQTDTTKKLDHYWIPNLPQSYLSAWEKYNFLGKEYYKKVSLPYYKSITTHIKPI